MEIIAIADVCMFSSLYLALGSLNLCESWMWYIRSPPLRYSITKNRWLCMSGVGVRYYPTCRSIVYNVYIEEIGSGELGQGVNWNGDRGALEWGQGWTRVETRIEWNGGGMDWNGMESRMDWNGVEWKGEEVGRTDWQGDKGKLEWRQEVTGMGTG